MKKYKLITDSGCDMSVEDEKKYGIDIMSFDIIFSNETLIERVDIGSKAFQEKLAASDEIPKTSQITEFRFEEKFEQCVKEGYEDVIVVLINGAGSKTYMNAVHAAQLLKEDGRAGDTNFYIVDSHTYSVGYGWPVIEAAKKLEAGQSAEMVVAYLEDWFSCCELYLIAFGLKHMKKSGRIKAAAAFMGELMNIKPLIAMIDDDTEVVLKSRGEKKAIADAIEYISSRAIPKTPMLIAGSLCEDLEKEFLDKYKEKTGVSPSAREYVGAAVASNAGTNFIGVFVKGQKRR